MRAHAERPWHAPNTGSNSAVYLSMIAVDRSRQGKGLGSDLAVDALSRARHAADKVEIKLVILDVIDDGGDEVFARRRDFYQRLGLPRGTRPRPSNQSSGTRPPTLSYSANTQAGSGRCASV